LHGFFKAVTINPKQLTQNMNANTKKALWVLGAVLVVAIVYALVVDKPASNDQSTNTNNNSQQPTPPPVDQEQPGTDETPAGPTPTPAPSRMSYNEALKTYGVNGYRFQFTDGCLSLPGKMTIKKGGKFMLDNRDDVAHTIKVGNQTFRLSKYGFAIATATQTGDLDISCDGTNRSELLVQP
jgi:hypothetical protein